MKKILHVLQSNTFSGAENVVVYIINSLENDYNFVYSSANGQIKETLEENKIKQAQPEEGNNTSQNEREIRKNIFKNERVNFILGVILVIFSLYLTISFISFFFTGSIDQSKVENLSVGELSSIGNEIQNWTGAFGAYLSNLMINRWMGILFFYGYMS